MQKERKEINKCWKKANDFVTLLIKLLSKMCLKMLVFSLPLPSANIRTVLQGEDTPSTKKGKRDDSLTTLTRNEQWIISVKVTLVKNNTGDGAGGGFGKLCAQISGKPMPAPEKSNWKEGLVHEVEAVPYKNIQKTNNKNKTSGVQEWFFF